MNDSPNTILFQQREIRSCWVRLASVLSAFFAALVSMLLVGCQTVVSPGGAATSSLTCQSSVSNGLSQKQQQKFSKKEAAHSFLLAFIQLDREKALHYASPEAVDKLDWSTSHRGDVPYYDDKMILHYPGGLAKVHFEQQANGGYKIADLQQY